ncbi:TIGR02921 family PEP-CTERM protein [Pseudanabaena sp. PCC 6802]|uniref:TIGR02921 family PEP-CTERM protein n=1 Tax=Pseudanabaena sp. PCC 6802 TaxID=118173 RepID=UPI0003488B8C|nr:TIGR02921 family PEP-CTERM protein [Pseudanabaena sp. PCC 6802]
MLFKIFFWVSNICFLLIAYLGVLPFIGASFWADLLSGNLPFDLLLPFIGLVGAPTVSTISRGVSGLKNRNEGSFSLAKLYFGVEAPIVLLCLLRLFWLHELTPATTFILLSVLVCVASFTYELSQPTDRTNNGNKLLAWMQMAAHSLMLLLGSYLLVICLFYALPALYLGGIGLIWSVFFPPLLPAAIALIAILIMPLGLAIAYVQAWRRFHHTFAESRGKLIARAVTLGTIGAWLGLLAVVQMQPQDRVFAMLSQPTGDVSKRQELLQKSNFIREGLLNAYLARYRYPIINEENSIIGEFYTFLRFPTEFVNWLQSAHNFVISPFVYNGTVKDSAEAEALYAQFFDRPILRAEQKAIQLAVNATFDRASAKAGLLSVNQKKVLLTKQEVSVKEHGDWADVELHEVYINKTSQQQEIFYAFSLPESAVLTGVWLGDRDRKSASFPFTVSTRGAAQKVYNTEVQRRVDPALLEQVGPQSYRLRVFPILPNFNRDATGKQSEMHMWMTYKVMGQVGSPANGWPLPQLAERRNVFWDKNTKRTFNGQAIASEDKWFEPLLPASSQIAPQQRQAILPNGDRVAVKPLRAQDYRLPKGKRFAIVLDGSRSMASYQEEIRKNFKWLEAKVEKDNDFDVFISATYGAKPQRIDNLQDLKLPEGMFYGLLRPQEILQQFSKLQGNTTYDAAIVLTDQGNYELTDEKASVSKITAPLWMVHLGGLPAAYDDATLDAISKSGGGVASSVAGVLERTATQAALGSSVQNVADGYAWSWESSPHASALDIKSDNSDRNTSKDNFLPLAARQVVRYISQDADLTQVSELDRIHALAKRYNIVTPYSSMIVLVNDEQREALKKAENESDRFKRTVEDNQLPQPSSATGIPTANVSGVPEPDQWLLIGIVVLALVAIAWRTDRAQNMENSVKGSNR